MKRIDFEAHFLSKGLRTALLERHCAPHLTSEDIMVFGADCSLPYAEIMESLSDLAQNRIQEMDQAGIDIQILSCVGGVELLPSEQGTIVARQTNDMLYQAIQAYPDRLRGYATLAPHDVNMAIDELERCVKSLGFVGWNAFSNFGEDGLDDPRYLPLLKKADELGIFIYLHPTMPTMERLHGYGRQLVASGLGFGIDVMTTLTRMILAGIFDQFPNLKIVLGHLGEGFPFILDRMRARGPKQSRLPAINERPAMDYFPTNVWVSTSGNYSPASFRCALDVLGPEHILLGSDYPMERLGDSVQFLDQMDLIEPFRELISWKNASKIFHIL